MNWIQLAMELTREAMKYNAGPAKPTEPIDLGTALTRQFELIDRNMDAIVQSVNAQNVKLAKALQQQKKWNYALAVALAVTIVLLVFVAIR